jgi:hypothetical protein
MTPLHITLALHYHAVDEPYSPHDREHANSKAVVRYTQDLVDAGMIVPDAGCASGYRGTDGLRAYVERLTKVPLPEAVTAWEFPDQAKKNNASVRKLTLFGVVVGECRCPGGECRCISRGGSPDAVEGCMFFTRAPDRAYRLDHEAAQARREGR